MEIKITKSERLFLLNQFRILAAIEGEEGEAKNGYSEKITILELGMEAKYEDVFSALRENEISEEIYKETIDIFEMFYMIAQIKEIESVEGKKAFEGFDGNNDHDHYACMKFILEVEKLYEKQIFVNNSHTSATLPRYRKMLAAYKELTNDFQKRLSLEEVKQVIPQY